MGQILLVRHGQASWGADDYDVLSELGERQAGVVGRALADSGVQPDLIVHGSLVRLRRTAELAMTAAGWVSGHGDSAASIEVREDPGWDEMNHHEVLAAMPPPHGVEKPSREQFQTWFEAATDRWIDGQDDGAYAEPWSAFGARVDGALDRVAGWVGRGKTAVVVTSGGPISRVSAERMAAGVDTYRRLAPVVINCSVTRLVTGRRGVSLVSFNEAAHLPAPLLTYR